MFNPPKLIGHRGVKNLSPENTLNSIELAGKLNLDWVEIDVKISKDLFPILLHDDTLERTTNGQGNPLNLKYNEIKNLDAGEFFYGNSTDIFVPTLFDVLSLCNKRKISLNIELKPNLGAEKENVKAIVELINSFKFNNHIYFSSFDLTSLFFIRSLMPDSFCGLLVDNFSYKLSIKDILEISAKYNFFSCGLNKEIINSNILDELKKNNLIVSAYSEENFKFSEAKSLWNLGVDTLFVDDPKELAVF